MRVLLTGGTGFVGRHLQQQFDASTVVFSPTSAEMDVREPESVKKAFRGFLPNLCIHLAAQSSQRRAFQQPVQTQMLNLQGTANVLEAAGPDCRVVLFSSCHVYGEPASLPIVESHPSNGTGVYAQSKIAAEHHAMGRLDRDWTLVRLFNLTGPGQSSHFAASDWAHQWAEGLKKIQTGDLSLLRDYLDVRDACVGIRTLAERAVSRQITNICSGESVALEDVFKWAAPGATGVSDSHRIRPNEPQEIRGCSKRLRALGWQPKIPLDQSLADLRALINAQS
jgi:GDP-4-dehydro-6-deoxy-D-mannose reductase